MLDLKVIVIGVAGIFLALGVAAAFMLGFGHITSALGQAVGSGPVAQAGDYLSGLGLDVIAVLITLAVIIVLAFLYVLFRK
jgi:hypothetical protein